MLPHMRTWAADDMRRDFPIAEFLGLTQIRVLYCCVWLKVHSEQKYARVYTIVAIAAYIQA